MANETEWIDPATAELFFNHLNSLVLILDKNQRPLYLNPSAERVMGLSAQIARDKPLEKLFRQGKEMVAAVQEVLVSGRTMKVYELNLETQQGSAKFQAEFAPLGPMENPSGVIAILQELSLAKALQEENRVLDRLSMMGTLASGLAHEIRNPLGGILAATQMLNRQMITEESREYTEMILSEVERLNRLIGQLLDFSKPKPHSKRALNINQLLSEVLLLESEVLKQHNIKIRQEFDPSLPPVFGDPESLKQALLNLIKNAMEAMPQGGSLRVATGYITDYKMLSQKGKTQAMAQITVADTGIGISPEDLERLFTPFFTTKPNGTGLGLMMTQRIMKEHEALLRIKSEVGKGTTFRLLLKLAAPKEKLAKD